MEVGETTANTLAPALEEVTGIAGEGRERTPEETADEAERTKKILLL